MLDLDNDGIFEERKEEKKVLDFDISSCGSKTDIDLSAVDKLLSSSYERKFIDIDIALNLHKKDFDVEASD